MINVTDRADGTGIIIQQGYGEHTVEILADEIVPTMEKMAEAVIRIKEGKGTKTNKTEEGNDNLGRHQSIIRYVMLMVVLVVIVAATIMIRG